MTVTVNDVIAPTGKLQHSLFPDGDLEENAAAWIARATTMLADIDGTYHDVATEHYVYYRAYSAVADRLAGEPNQVSIESAARVSKSVDSDRIAYFKRLAREHKDAFDGYITFPPNPDRPRSVWVQNRIVF